MTKHRSQCRIEESLCFTNPKKAIFDCEILKNFRPVSNLSLLPKLVERIVCEQLVGRLKAHHLYEVFQSAYRQLDSTETGLLRVQNDLLRAVDTHEVAILILCDLSAAFDTIDHQRLLHSLESSFDIKGNVLDWFQSYLTGRTQIVQIKKSTSEPHELNVVYHRSPFWAPFYSPSTPHHWANSSCVNQLISICTPLAKCGSILIDSLFKSWWKPL